MKRKEKKRKEKKSLLYLITIVTVIALMVFACKNKPTGTNDFITVDETLTNAVTNNQPPDTNIAVDKDKPDGEPKGDTTDKEDGFLSSIAGAYQSDSIYQESGKQYNFKAYIDKYGTNTTSTNKYCLKLYKGADLNRTMYRDKTKDIGNKKALFDWQTHFIEKIDDSTLHLTLSGWGKPIVLKKQ